MGAAGHVDFEEPKNRPQAGPSDSPSECKKCTYFELQTDIRGYWDTVRDARQTYQSQREVYIPSVWAALYKKFKCPPKDGDSECKFVAPCPGDVTVVAGFAELEKDPADNVLRWRVYIVVGRKLQCLKSGPNKDIDPDPPKPPWETPPKKTPEKEPEKKEKDSEKPKDKGSEKPGGPGW